MDERLTEVIKALKPTYVLNQDDSRFKTFFNEGIKYSLSYCNESSLIYLFHKTKPITKITKKEAKNLVNLYAVKRLQRECDKKILQETKVFTLLNKKRLFPLSIDDYNKFAESYWTKRGRPSFKKRIVNGAVFGSGSIVTNGKSGWYQKIYRRYIGIYPAKTKDGRVTIQIHVPN